jgi:RNA polymerase sigma-70 factor (ECF subfamily)
MLYNRNNWFSIYNITVTYVSLGASYSVEMTNTDNEQELIAQIIRGEQQHFAVLVDRYQSMAFTIALRYTKNREDAEEIAQSAFVKAYRCLADYRGDAKFSTWLFTIVRSLALSFLRKNQLDTLSLSIEKVQLRADSMEGGFSANQVEKKCKIEMVHKAIQLLGADDAQVLSLFYQGEQTLEEIGQIMGIEPNTVKVKLHRARAKLKKTMESSFAEEIKNLQQA